MNATIIERYHNGAGVEYARRYQLEDGVRVCVDLDKQRVSWADPEFWADPKRYGAERVYCPGHGRSRVCPYGMHDYIKLAVK